MKVIFIFIVVLGSLISDGTLHAQSVEDSTGVVETTSHIKKGSIFKGRPGKSMLMSLVIPGSGQIYNKSYLRVPFVWGAVGGVGWLMIYNTREYRCLRDAYIHKIDGTPYTPTKCSKTLKANIPLYTDAATIRLVRDQANKNKQASIVGFAFVWLLNGVDAFVDAHLKDFDIDEDLSFNIETRMGDDPNAPMKVGLYVQF
ncbi:MAG: hypothetical protein IPP15_03975 [Saprospiraceae bacterium]|uniref:DUF5683 domain-containing protein n=1 Tax=Candidatus Opimibacter skivensis TaxID=2982028 RepID=A0A9D7SVA9_9BACT|nr:hypothetical protein [Candidatus Opimibacter skivensis]